MTAETLRIALAQLNPHPGALRANAARILRAREEAARLGADLVVTPQSCVAGHPPQALARDPDFLADCAAAIADLAAATADGGPGLVVGGPWQDGGRVHDALFVLDGGRILARRARHEVPEPDGVFDPGPCPGPVAFRGVRLGLMIGEDWRHPAVAETLAETGAEILVALGASPFEAERPEARMDLAVQRVVEAGLPFLLANQVGGQDGLVFDGLSFVLNPDRSLAVLLPPFEEALCLTHWRRDGDGALACAPQRPLPPAPARPERIYRAMMLGLSDFVAKNRFPGVALGLSGGVGSALTAAIAADALGPERVLGVMLPSPGTGADRLRDAAACARLLGIRLETVEIGPALQALGGLLAPALGGRPPPPGLEPDLRGAALQALADAAGALLLATADRTGLSTGRAPLHGGFAVLKDAYRSTVLELARWRNAHLPAGARGPDGPVVPERVLAQASLRAEREGLPPLDALDAILRGLAEEGRSVDALAAEGHDRATVLRIRRLLGQAESRRRQAPIGVKLGPCGRRYPISNGYTELVA